MIPHRSTALLTIIVFVALLLVIFSSSPNPNPNPNSEEQQQEQEVSGPSKYIPKLPSLSLGDLHLPSFRPTAHTPPPEQKNSTSGESKWYSDLSWLNPFSSSITLDENRSVLPPLRDRPFIYTYYDSKNKNDDDEENSDGQLLLAWRRAWFAQGFRPVVLGRGEAMNNPLYESVQRLKLTRELEDDLFRWLAWGHMGTGLLADWRCFPMARYDDEMLSALRRGTIPTHITRFDHLGSGLFAGEKARIKDALDEAIKKIEEKSMSMLDLIPADLFRVEQTNALAFYSSAAVTTHYPTLAEKSVSSPTTGRSSLVQLINSHLHTTFQNSFPAGIAVLKPYPEHTTALVEPALRLAKALAQCSESPIPTSCPPNLPKCHPCSADKPASISQPSTYRNTTHVFTIGTLPHPYTLISLQHSTDAVTTRLIRRETERDAWLQEVTKEHLGEFLPGSSRAVVFKKAVADDPAVGSSLWMTVEALPPDAGQALPSELLDEFEWQLGFKIPREGNVDAKNEGKAKETMQNANPSEQGIEKEFDLLSKSRAILQSKDTNRIGIKDVAEAWNLADTETWRFVRAYRARSVVERKRWEEEEKHFFGARSKE
ncbi:hypothetical protein ASPWEDRAFT_22777 [Aspergillus wentii DTO 134E9]|uniref:Uncharacterized protein n=1 Tax=Aspergillus wentii DTO 134E9 TaxID=1073089 RepID=A0A1L9S0D4_ASPWE|nr:uncharacterized protein ASPWEDRAFT_22777 [Aspergillus wentii DTO 134E9]KAI9933029.1 hypothetical protein MW887_009283 [Aspergillus wentii]OJJ40612.1 hypothetical protein ASPWEDRAFT_22777 [Aspergillus wentii DTO 134E9]